MTLFRAIFTIINKLTLIVILLCVSSLLLISSCTIDNSSSYTEQEGWAQRLSSKSHNLSAPYLENWVIIEEKYREGVLSLHSEKIEGDYQINLVVTILPTVMKPEEMSLETKRILESSLYNLHSIAEPEIIEFENFIATVTDAEAGDLDPVNARAAGFSTGGYSYLFIVLAGEDSFEFAVTELDNILESIKFN